MQLPYIQKLLPFLRNTYFKINSESKRTKISNSQQNQWKSDVIGSDCTNNGIRPGFLFTDLILIVAVVYYDYETTN